MAEPIAKYPEQTKGYRSITKEVAEKYGVTTGVDKSEDKYRAYPYPHKTKYRVLPKDFSKNLGFTNNYLFGMDKFNAGTSRAITIVEGEDDTLSAYQMLGEKWPVVGLPGAKISDNLLQNCFKYLDSFESIVVATDNDEAGNGAADKLATVFPNKVYRVNMTTHNDPNEYLVNGDAKDFLFAWINKKKYVPEGVFNTPEQFKEILSTSEGNEFIPTPIESLNTAIKGLMKGHLTILTGPEGQGKTEILRLFEHHILSTQPNVPIAVLHMEESNKTTLTSYACYQLKKNIRDPEHSVPQVDIDNSIEALTKDNNLFLFNFSIDEDPLTILDKVRYFSGACGCEYIFIDPIQQLSYGKEKNQSEEQTLTQIAVQLERLATELNIGIVLTTHVNDDGQTRSSRMIGKSASVRIDLSRDHMNPDEDIRNTTKLSVSKNRPTGRTGYGGTLYFDPSSFTLKEMD